MEGRKNIYSPRVLPLPVSELITALLPLLTCSMAYKEVHYGKINYGIYQLISSENWFHRVYLKLVQTFMWADTQT